MLHRPTAPADPPSDSAGAAGFLVRPRMSRGSVISSLRISSAGGKAPYSGKVRLPAPLPLLPAARSAPLQWLHHSDPSAPAKPSCAPPAALSSTVSPSLAPDAAAGPESHCLFQSPALLSSLNWPAFPLPANLVGALVSRCAIPTSASRMPCLLPKPSLAAPARCSPDSSPPAA